MKNLIGMISSNATDWPQQSESIALIHRLVANLILRLLAA
jgi:hypothetical protein